MGAPYAPKAIFTTSMARTTPAQNPRGFRSRIFFSPVVFGAIVFKGIGKEGPSSKYIIGTEGLPPPQRVPTPRSTP